MLKHCKRCTTEFESNHNKQTHCSLRCRFWDKVEIRGLNDCWIWTGCIVKDGYGMIALGNRRNITSSRLAWKLTYGEIPDEILVLHDCPNGDCPACCNPAHLWTGTDLDNNRDMVIKGRAVHLAGEESPSCKISVEDIGEIRRLHEHKSGLGLNNYQLRKAGLTNADIGKRFGISDSHVVKIVGNRHWVHGN